MYEDSVECFRTRDKFVKRISVTFVHVTGYVKKKETKNLLCCQQLKSIQYSAFI